MTDSKSLFYKAGCSAIVGFPIAYMINISALPILNGLIHENILLAGLLLALPFIFASWIRIYAIDYIYSRYKLNIEPIHMIRKAVRGEIIA